MSNRHCQLTVHCLIDDHRNNRQSASTHYFRSFAGSPEVASDVHVACNSNEIIVSISTSSGRFNGMIYPRGLSKNSTCMGEWVQRPSPVQYTLPLRGCNTMSTELVSFFLFWLIFCARRLIV